MDSMDVFFPGETNGIQIAFAGGAVTIEEETTAPVDAFENGCSPMAFSKWPATSRNGAPIGISGIFISVTPPEI